MGALGDGRFWAGVIVGALAYYAWLKYQAKQAT